MLGRVQSIRSYRCKQRTATASLRKLKLLTHEYGASQSISKCGISSNSAASVSCSCPSAQIVHSAEGLVGRSILVRTGDYTDEFTPRHNALEWQPRQINHAQMGIANAAIELAQRSEPMVVFPRSTIEKLACSLEICVSARVKGLLTKHRSASIESAMRSWHSRKCRSLFFEFPAQIQFVPLIGPDPKSACLSLNASLRPTWPLNSESYLTRASFGGGGCSFFVRHFFHHEPRLKARA
jgi:hypothetical protein